MINKQIEKIELNDLKQLRSNAVSEGKTIEYKRQLPTNSAELDREWISSHAR